MRRLDRKLIPWLCLLYLTSFLDRTNIGNAKINGLLKDLHLTNGTYNAALSVFFVSYALFEPLTNVLLKSWTPRIFLTVTIVLWGLCMTFMGFCSSFAGLAAARFFLGVAEAGLFPGVNYYLSCLFFRTTSIIAIRKLTISNRLVQERRVWHSCCYFLLCCCACWILWWTACCCYREDEWYCRKTRLVSRNKQYSF